MDVVQAVRAHAGNVMLLGEDLIERLWREAARHAPQRVPKVVPQLVAGHRAIAQPTEVVFRVDGNVVQVDDDAFMAVAAASGGRLVVGAQIR